MSSNRPGARPTARLKRAVAGRISSLCHAERGAVMVIVAASMAIFLGMLAMAVDVEGWFQTHARAQSTADAAALAAANDMAGGDTTSGATTAAINYAADNGLTITSSNVSINTSTDQVTVTVPTTAHTFFSGLFGINSPTVSAKSLAAWTPGTATGCSNPGSTCYTFFAMDRTCSDDAISLTGGNDTINGGVYSSASELWSGGNDTFKGPINYGAGTGCNYSASGGNMTYDDGTPTAASADITSWPINYATVFPACTGAACTGPDGTPSFCTYAHAGGYVFSQTAASGVYCAVGTGTASTPTTWNGSITLAGNITATLTLIGGSISGSAGNMILTADKSNLVAWATTGSISFTGGNDTWTGDIFDPNGTVSMSGGNAATTTMIEAQDISISGGNLTGDGPADTGGSVTTGGSDSLVG